jgi:hypothetical protein
MMASDPDKRVSTPEALIRELMFVAEELGLKGVSSEGMVWMSAGALSGRSWEKHIGWMATVALLLIVVVVLRFQPVDRGDSIAGFGAGSDSPAAVAAAVAGAGTAGDTVDPTSVPMLSDAVKGTAGDPRTGAAVPSVDPAGGDTRSAGGAAAAGSGGGAGTTVPSVSEPVRPGVAASDTPAGTSSPKTAGGAATVPDPATAETPAVTKPAAPAAVATSDPPPPPVVVISVDGTRQRAYPTLNAALVDAVDGSQVVLQYIGRTSRSEVPRAFGRGSSFGPRGPEATAFSLA